MLTGIGGGWYLEKSALGLPPLNRKKLSKSSQGRHDCIQKKLYEYNRWWNDWKLQSHWNKLEWVYPKSNPKRVKTFSVSTKSFILVKMIEKLILLVIIY